MKRGIDIKPSKKIESYPAKFVDSIVWHVYYNNISVILQVVFYKYYGFFKFYNKVDSFGNVLEVIL